MVRKRYVDEETHHGVTANIVEAMGRGLLIATAGLVLGAILGTSSAAIRFGAGALVASGVIGAGCMIASALIRNAGCRRRQDDGEQASQAAEIMAIVATLPIVIEHEPLDHGKQPARHVERVRLERHEGVDAGRGI